mmetsp:Transcript_6300/g.25157  ORF Transcript_6300/g.25157 Transcript_6300/m.25157 type:complete len:291 (+) Transcript_6300:1328-2200(+)
MQRGRHRLPSNLPRLQLLQRHAQSKQKFTRLRDRTLDVPAPVVEQHLFNAIGVAHDDVRRDRSRRKQIHRPALSHPLEQRLKQPASEQSRDILQFRVRHGNLRRPAPQSVQLRHPIRRRHRRTGARLIRDGRLLVREVDEDDVIQVLLFEHLRRVFDRTDRASTARGRARARRIRRRSVSRIPRRHPSTLTAPGSRRRRARAARDGTCARGRRIRNEGRRARRNSASSRGIWRRRRRATRRGGTRTKTARRSGRAGRRRRGTRRRRWCFTRWTSGCRIKGRRGRSWWRGT